MAEKPNGEEVRETKENLYDVFQRLILEPSKIKASLIPLFPEASRNYSRHLLLWSRQGSPLRRLLFISVGIVALVALSGFLAFLLFFLAATINAVFVSFLISLAVAGGFLALFFAFVTAIYIGALSVAIFAISTVTFWAVVAIIITAGNNLFFSLFSSIEYFMTLLFYYVFFMGANSIILPALGNDMIQDGLDSFIPCG
ncbi:hypothetical protein CR513_43077, partial [Mucuna pruriens]